MAKSNWKGSSGWGAIDDPTTALSGRVLVVSAGATQTTEDYLTQVVGTSTAFDVAHYCVKMDYAFASGSYEFEAGTLGLIARAGSYSGGSPSTAQDCYIASFSNKSSSVDIIRRKSGVEDKLATAGLPENLSTVARRHTMEFKCYGTSPTRLQLYIDDSIAINIGDNTSSEITSGDAGIHVQGGTVYADNFTVIEYTSSGTEPSLWVPSNVSTPANISVWLRSDSGITTSAGGVVTAWTDKSTNANNASATTVYGPSTITGGLNGYDTVTFSGTKYLIIGDSATVDLNSSGVSFIAMTKTTVGSASTLQGIITKDATWLYSIEFNSASPTPLGSVSFSDGTTPESSTAGSVTANTWNIMVMNKSDKFYVNGAEQGASAGLPAADNTNEVIVGAWYENATSTFSNYLTGEIAEVIVYAGQLTTDERQRIEGYMAHRYGVQSNLPSTHPYRNFAPTV